MQFMDGAHGWRGWQGLFVLDGISSVIIGIFVLAILPDGGKSASSLTRDERELLIARIGDDNVSKGVVSGRHSLSDAFKDGRLGALALVYLALATCFYAVGFWMPTIIQGLGIDKKDLLKVGLASMIPWGASIVATVYRGSHSHRTGERQWHCASGLLMIMVGLLMLSIAAKSPIVSIVGLTLITMGWAGCVCTFWSLPTAFLSRTAAATGNRLDQFGRHLGRYFGRDLIGTIRAAAHGAEEAAFFTLAAIALVGALIVIFTVQ